MLLCCYIARFLVDNLTADKIHLTVKLTEKVTSKNQFQNDLVAKVRYIAVNNAIRYCTEKLARHTGTKN